MKTDIMILKFLKISPEMTGKQISEKLGINRVTISKYLMFLEAKNLIECDVIGRAKVWSLVK